MADTKISALSAVSAVAAANELPLNEAGTTKKATALQLQTFMSTKGSNVASATITVLGAGEFFHITGVTTITDIDFADSWDGRRAFVVFDGILTLTHNATTLILPGGVNITTAAGDAAIFVVDSGDNIKCVGYFKADGTVLIQSATLTGRLTPPAGAAGASTAPLQLVAGTLQTTAEDGAVEMDGDCFYGCTDAGNRGYIPVRHFIRANATRTFTSNTTSQAIFTSPTNGTLTLEVGTYLFEGILYFTAMSATSGNLLINMLGAGTATIAAWLWDAVGVDGAAGTAAAYSGTAMITSTSPASIVTAGTGTALSVRVSGTFQVTVAGTIIPSITMVTASSTVLAVGSFLVFERIGNASVVSIGQWT